MLLLDQWLLVLAIGALCGFLGQCLRVVVGLHKASNEGPVPFDPIRLVVSLLVGVLAGSVAAIASVATLNPYTGAIDGHTVLALMAAGYAGADFIEGFIGKYLPK